MKNLQRTVHAASHIVFLASWFAVVELPADENTWTFEDNEVGVLPEVWKQAKTGAGPGSLWKVVADQSAPSGSQALAQMSSAGPRPLFPAVPFPCSYLP